MTLCLVMSQSLHKSGQFGQYCQYFKEAAEKESQSLHKSGQFGLVVAAVTFIINGIVAIPS